MNNTVSKILIFTAGAVIGSAVTYKLLNDKYTKRAEQEIKEMKEYYEGKYSTDEDGSYDKWIKENPDFTESEKEEYRDIVKNYIGEKGGSETMEIGTPPYVISPEEFDSEDEYETVSLTYYTDGVLADDDDEVIDDVENTVGKDFDKHFGEYEDDSVFIRNEMLKTDYEILMDYRPFSEIIGKTPNPKDDE